jgi:hypothetical protein
VSHEIRHDSAPAIGDVEYADSARDSHSDSPHLAVANISLFAMLKQQCTEVCTGAPPTTIRRDIDLDAALRPQICLPDNPDKGAIYSPIPNFFASSSTLSTVPLYLRSTTSPALSIAVSTLSAFFDSRSFTLSRSPIRSTLRRFPGHCRPVQTFVTSGGRYQATSRASVHNPNIPVPQTYITAVRCCSRPCAAPLVPEAAAHRRVPESAAGQKGG